MPFAWHSPAWVLPNSVSSDRRPSRTPTPPPTSSRFHQTEPLIYNRIRSTTALTRGIEDSTCAGQDAPRLTTCQRQKRMNGKRRCSTAGRSGPKHPAQVSQHHATFLEAPRQCDESRNRRRIEDEHPSESVRTPLEGTCRVLEATASQHPSTLVERTRSR